MRKNTSIRLLTSITLAAIMLTSVFAAFQTMPAQAAVQTVTLTIDNRSTSPIIMYLTGPYQYYLTVPAESIKSFTLNRGTYDYTVRGCGRTAENEIELKRNTMMINPVCGGKIRTIPKDPSKVDLSRDIRVVPVTIISELDYKTFVILTGPSTYVFTLKPEQELEVTIGKGVYDVRYYACGVNITREFQAYKQAKFYMRCP